MICVTVPLPSFKVSPNARTHFRVRANLIYDQRQEAREAAMVAAYDCDLKEPITDAIVQIVRWNKTVRLTDPDNLIAQLKASFDGITDAGVWIDDLNVMYLPPLQRKDSTNPRVELWIRQSPGGMDAIRRSYFPMIPTE